MTFGRQADGHDKQTCARILCTPFAVRASIIGTQISVLNVRTHAPPTPKSLDQRIWAGDGFIMDRWCAQIAGRQQQHRDWPAGPPGPARTH